MKRAVSARVASALTSCLLLALSPLCSATNLFLTEKLGADDAVYVVDDANHQHYGWRVDAPMVPASLSKLATAYLALEKWGAKHHFITDFYLDSAVLWVKGYGDPYLISEELDLIVKELRSLNLRTVTEIRVDNSFFSINRAPGRSNVSDPYNAPLSAVSANFNTAMLRNLGGQIVSAESQTPLTETALRVARGIGGSATRVNLENSINAQQNFAELLIAKMGWKNVSVAVDQSLPSDLPRLLRHSNTRSLQAVLRGTLEYSNNFIANQVFLKLAEQTGQQAVSFEAAAAYAQSALETNFNWRDFNLADGAGLTRENRLSARQIDDLLRALAPHKRLLKEYLVDRDDVSVYAKTGTLTNVHSFAGFIDFSGKSYRFVFNFNRPVTYRYRNKLLGKLVLDLKQVKPAAIEVLQ